MYRAHFISKSGSLSLDAAIFLFTNKLVKYSTSDIRLEAGQYKSTNEVTDAGTEVPLYPHLECKHKF